jgi:hypothetical protein
VTFWHVVQSVVVAAGCFTLSVIAGRWTWHCYQSLCDSLRAERERRRAHEQWLEERRRLSTPGDGYTGRPPFDVQ